MPIRVSMGFRDGIWKRGRNLTRRLVVRDARSKLSKKHLWLLAGALDKFDTEENSTNEGIMDGGSWFSMASLDKEKFFIFKM